MNWLFRLIDARSLLQAPSTSRARSRFASVMFPKFIRIRSDQSAVSPTEPLPHSSCPCVDAPVDASVFFGGFGPAVRCFRVSGLSLRHGFAAGLYGDARIGFQLGLPCSSARRT